MKLKYISFNISQIIAGGIGVLFLTEGFHLIPFSKEWWCIIAGMGFLTMKWNSNND